MDEKKLGKKHSVEKKYIQLTTVEEENNIPNMFVNFDLYYKTKYAWLFNKPNASSIALHECNSLINHK